MGGPKTAHWFTLARCLPLSSGESGFSLANQVGKARSIMDGDVGQDLAVELDACHLQTVNELRIAETAELGGGVDAHDPKRTVLALLLLTAGEGEFEAALYGFLGCLIELGLSEEVPTGAL